METNNITPESIENMDNEKKEKQGLDNNPNKFNEKNYLNVRLDTKNNELTREIRIRLLPIDGSSSKAFQKIHMHYVKVNKKISASGFKNYICLSKTDGIDVERFGNKCPFCDIKNGAWKKYEEETDEAVKGEWLQLFKDNCSNEYAIVRCIERGHEDEGPKFWKFSVRSDEKDPMNTIIKLYKTRKKESIEEEYGTEFLNLSKEEQEARFAKDGFKPINILDIYEGKDLKLTLNAVYDKQNKLTDKVTIDIADYGRIKPIAETQEQIDAWVNDNKKWNDVFAAKPYEYLEIVSEGGVPYFDKKQNKWVPWDDEYSNKKVTEEAAEVNHDIMESAANVKNMDAPTSNNESELPF